jgi:hypothetical protein
VGSGAAQKNSGRGFFADAHFRLGARARTEGGGRADCDGGAVHDARIAAICIAHGIEELWTSDRDFARFPDLRIRDPLIPSIHEPDGPAYPAPRRNATRLSPARRSG